MLSPSSSLDTTRSVSLDDSCRLPSVAGYTAGLCPTIWSGLSPRPSPLWVNTPSLRAIIPTPRGEVVTPQLVTTSKAFRNRVLRQLLHSPDTCFCRVNLTTLQCSLHATARRLASPPVQVRPGVPQPTRTFTPELSRGGSPKPRVGYDYTAPLGRDCDRTCTGWNAAVTGCALPCKLPLRGPHFHASWCPLLQGTWQFCRKFSFEVIWGMISPYDSW